MDIAAYTYSLYEFLSQRGDKNIAQQQSKYMRNRVPFFGMKSPVWEAHLKSFILDNGKIEINDAIKFAENCFEYPEREMHHSGLFFLRKYAHKLKSSDIPKIKALIIKGDWWDTTDSIAPTVVGGILKSDLKARDSMNQWILDQNFWIRRSALIFQLKYGNELDFEKLKNYIQKTKHEKEFFIRKAIGWSLREYSKYNTKAVLDFVDEHTDLSNLSKTEALKWWMRKNAI
jgi:3-methyladenine DNA glycosylase AlkD